MSPILKRADRKTISLSLLIDSNGTVAPNGSVTAPPGGGAIQYVSTSGGVSGAGRIASAGGTNGSEFISDVFSANSGDDLKFDFNYVTADGAGFSDYGFAELQTSAGAFVAYLFTARTTTSGNTSPGFGLPANSATLTPSGAPIIGGAPVFSPLGGSSGYCYSTGCGYTGWISSLYNINAGGDYRLRFGVTNVGDTGVDPALAFSGLKIADVAIGGAVPEPSTWALMLIGFGAIGGSMRRARRVKPIYQIA